MNEAVFYHAECPVSVSAERQFAVALDPARYQFEAAHPSEQRKRIAEAAGVKSVPELVIGGAPFHINFGAALADLR